MQSEAGSKRVRGIDEPADAAARPAVSDVADRFVRQRIDASSAPTAAAGLFSAMSASSSAAFSSVPDPSSAATPAPLSFLRLAVVERQLIMEGLDFTSLARLACTCKQLRSESLHPASGRILRVVKSVTDFGACAPSSAIFDCSLVRAHVHIEARHDDLDWKPDARTSSSASSRPSDELPNCPCGTAHWTSPRTTRCVSSLLCRW